MTSPLRHSRTNQFVTGYLLSGRTPAPFWAYYGAGLLLLGYLCDFVEVFSLWKWYGTSPYQDCVFGTFLLGLGSAMLALSPGTTILTNRSLATLGRYALGIYLVHYLFVDLVHPLQQLHSVVWEVLCAPIVLLLSLITVVLLSHFQPLRRFVM